MADHTGLPHVTRTIRAAVRLGEDAVTLESSVTLPLDADDVQLEQALQLSQRLHEAQYAAFEQQISRLRDPAGRPAPVAREAETPASERQRNYIAALQEDLGWSSVQLEEFIRRRGCDPAALTRNQASALIDELRRSPDDEAGGPAAAARPVQQRQRRALEQVALQRGLDLAAEILQRFNCRLEQLSADQAAQLLLEWQAAPAARGRFSGLSRG